MPAPRQRSLLTATLLIAGLLSAAVPAHAAPASSTEAAVVAAKDSLARELAVSLTSPAWASTLRSAVAAGHTDVLALTAGRSLAGAAAAANRAVLAAKGLPTSTGSVLEARLSGRGPITYVAAEVADDDATTITAYTAGGRARQLDVHRAPDGAVLVIGVSEQRALDAGLGVVRSELASLGVGSAAPAATGGFWTTRLMTVRLNDDEEPWFKGDAEIYTIVTGVGVDGKPQADIVQMPYLDNDGTTYSPGQILVDWSHFKYNAVDAVMMEEDDGTNYRALAQAIATALLTVLDGVQYAPMVNAILAAMPDSWWTDDPDYVDSWYLLTKQSNGYRQGARGNGTASFAPYYVTQN